MTTITFPKPCRLGKGCQYDPDCTDARQCWEPCGELGHSAEHARRADAPLTEETRWDAIMRAVSAMARAYAAGDVERARRHLQQAGALMEQGNA